ncbi:hypothetical protein Tco_1020367 [Tanacetum coccineum]|uniref:Uncharacterized protein n=1 Tax=Tanacetum coccineum TaxID=301880 RepID=A0ABQ5G210_9ASTR
MVGWWRGDGGGSGNGGEGWWVGASRGGPGGGSSQAPSQGECDECKDIELGGARAELVIERGASREELGGRGGAEALWVPSGPH